MPRMILSRSTAIVALSLLGCGASASVSGGATVPPIATARDATPRSPAMPASPIRSEPRVDIAGTGVSMVPPIGATPMRFGAGFVGRERELEIVVAIAEDEDALRELESFGAGGEDREIEGVTIDGRDAQLVVDRTDDTGEPTERVWFIVRDGARGLAVLGDYAASASDRLREPVRRSLLSTRWNATALIDAERAAGYRVDAPAGLLPVPEVANGLTYALPGTRIAFASGRPMLLVVPLGLQVPEPERASDCDTLLFVAGPIPLDTVLEHHDFRTETIEGCEVLGREEVPRPQGDALDVATYAAVVFLDDDAFLLAGIAEASSGALWTPAFAAATRTLSVAPR